MTSFPILGFRFRSFLVVFAVLTCGGLGAQAQNLVQNGSFESPAVSGLETYGTGNGGSLLAPWNILSGDVDVTNSNGNPAPKAGTQLLDISGFTPGSIEQAFATQSGRTYKLSFYMSGSPGTSPQIKRVEVLIAGRSQTFTYDSAVVTAQWELKELSFTATSTSTTLRFTSVQNDGSPFGAYLDEVSVVAASAVPANDNFASATALSGSSGSVNGTTVGATRETGEPNHGGLGASRTVWYVWTSPGTGTATFQLSSSAFTPFLNAYSGSSLGTIGLNGETNVAGPFGSNPSVATFSVVAGRVYRFAVVDSGANAGSFTLSFTGPTGVSVPANDNFASATALSGSSGSVNGTTVGATRETGEPNHGGLGASRTVWYVWTSPGTGTATFQLSSSAFTPFLNAYSGSSLGTIGLNGETNVAGPFGSNPSVATFSVVAGRVYRFAVVDSGADAGSFTLSFTGPSGGGTIATHTSTGYLAGGPASITVTIDFPSGITSLAYRVVLPTGWSYGGGSNEPAVKPSMSQTGTLDWAWTTLPSSPATFVFVANVPASASGSQLVSGAAITRSASTSGATEVAAAPNPLTLQLLTTASYHSADTNRDRSLSLTELTRVIELFNTLNGTARTGEYHTQVGTEDGFAPGSGAVTVYHSADTNRDGRLSLTELTRVIELFNTLSGTSRTGQYHVQSGTEDGFAPGP